MNWNLSIQKLMSWRTPILSSSTLRSLLQTLDATKCLPQITQLHQHLATAGLTGDPSLVTKLLQLYADAGDLSSALRLFAVLPCPSVFAWTPIIAFLSRSADHPRCLAAYRSMRSADIAPDGYVFPPVLRSAAAHHPSATAALHAEAIKFEATSAVPVANALIDAYSKCDDLPSARRTFDLAGARDLLSWNSIISAYASVGRLEPILSLLDSMGSDGCNPDLVTWNTIMDGYCRAGRCSEARSILYRLSQPNAVSWTTVIAGYGRSANHEAALEIFSRMMHAGNVPPDHDMLSCVVASCRQVANSRAGRSVHAYGLKTTPPDAFYGSAGAALVLLYACSGRSETCRRVFELMDRTDVVTWNAVIHGLAQCGLESVALDHFRDMISRGIGSNDVTLSTVLALCNLKLGKEVHAHAIKHDSDGYSTSKSNALINMYSRSGCIRAAHQVFSSMDVKDVATWNAMIGAYGSHGSCELAVQLANQMMQLGLEPNAATFTSILTAFAHCGSVDRGLELFERLTRDFGFEPSREHYACVVDMLARAGRLEEAAGFIGRMPGTAGAKVWGALLSACRMYQSIEFGEVAFEQLIRLEPENPGNYVTMSSIYARAGRWREAEKVRKMMEGEYLWKPSGQSWIDVA
ncbi:pentatricopeptide repeat-containing protein DOT4, chloroplastic-like [Canna indica]|uniref:Pentatricopeptide repeat-containing protein DOT4, chloroplastic-like n=1 Tax=Canna indica TaxID=4628 RepID=A0AAQ3QR98_9LILI|nr:pentatricopeptide repeat-containing protein DOT4, chloroplastic-like [Canna indica]